MKTSPTEIQLLEAKVSLFRREHGLGLGNPVDLELLLKQLQVRTVFKPLDGSFSGMAMKYADKSYMLVNSDHSKGKQNFTIAHEVYHLFVQHNFVPHASQAGRFGSQTDPEERNADWFAALLLMPASYIYAVVSEAGEMEPRVHLTLATVVKLEQAFRCSRQALLVRLENLRLITSTQREEWTLSPAASARHYDYPTDLYRSTPQREAIGDYVALASRLFDKERLSETHYAGLLADFGVDIHSIGTETPD